jgi:AraC-like DNA-binding protein
LKRWFFNQFNIAFKYGYQSIEGFSRAFRDWSGQAPSEVMKTQIQKIFPLILQGNLLTNSDYLKRWFFNQFNIH